MSIRVLLHTEYILSTGDAIEVYAGVLCSRCGAKFTLVHGNGQSYLCLGCLGRITDIALAKFKEMGKDMEVILKNQEGGDASTTAT